MSHTEKAEHAMLVGQVKDLRAEVDKLKAERDASPEKNGHNQSCYWCGEPCNIIAGNPRLWPQGFPHSEEPGVVRWHHTGCVMDRIAERDAALKQLPEGMKHCTIVLKECALGHAWLTAANWVQHECPTCGKADLERQCAAMREALRRTAVCRAKTTDNFTCERGYGHSGGHQTSVTGPLMTFATHEPVVFPAFNDLFPALATDAGRGWLSPEQVAQVRGLVLAVDVGLDDGGTDPYVRGEETARDILKEALDILDKEKTE